MPEAPTPSDTRIGLALSGGGFRATLYHCGALIRLNELGYLPKLDRITSVSGGSITSARLAARWSKLQFDEKGVASNLDEEVIQPLRKFCRQTLDTRVIARGLIPFTKSATERLIEAYNTQLLDGMTLDRLPQRPDFIFQATNLQTGRGFRFSRKRVADYLVGEIRDTSKFKVAQAVAASSAFPPVLSPVAIKVKQSDWSDMEGTEFFGQSSFMLTLNLTDGGVYDNLGLERIDRFGTILCSDAGKPFTHGPTFGPFSPKQILRALDIGMDQARARRTSALFAMQRFTGQKLGYWGIDMGKTLEPAAGLLPRAPEVVKKITALRTRLNEFTTTEQGLLINWGYACCDERMRSYVVAGGSPPTGLPVPDVPLS
jgi:NTE family protein